MKAFMMAAAMLAGIAANAANAAPLPEAKPEDVGFSQQGLARLDDFFAREIAAKRVPGAVVAIARDGKLVQYKAYGQLDPAKGTAMPLDAIFALASMTKPMAAVAGLTSTALSHVRCVIGFGSSCSQPLLLNRPSSIVGSGRNAISKPEPGAAGATPNAGTDPEIAPGAIARVANAVLAITPS